MAQQPDYEALAKRFGGTTEGPASAEQFTDPQQPPDLRRDLGVFLSNMGEVLNPMTMVQGLGDVIAHPAQTLTTMAQQQLAQADIARQRFHEGRTSAGLGHLVAGAMPILGPIAAQAGEQMYAGDVAGGLGTATGLVAPALAPTVGRATARAVPNRMATALEEGAASRYADVMTPKVGANKTRFGNAAEKVAPRLAANPDMSAWTRQGLQGHVEGRLAQAEMGLDEASNARLSARTFKTQPLLADLMEARRRLTAETVEASSLQHRPSGPPTTRTSMGIPGAGNRGGAPTTTTVAAEAAPFGHDVVPGPNAARVAMIDQAIEELRQLGPAARYESIRRIREAYDQPAKARYNPSVTQDYLKAQGGASGAADVTSVLRDHLAKFDPETAAANADYSLYRTASDVLKATEEIERVRPTVGRQIIARGFGTITGHQAAGVPGAVVGYALGPIVDAALNAGVTTKLKTAQIMSRLAQAIRGGNQAQATSLMSHLTRLTAQSLTITGLQEPPPMRVTSPTGSQAQPVTRQ